MSERLRCRGLLFTVFSLFPQCQSSNPGHSSDWVCQLWRHCLSSKPAFYGLYMVIQWDPVSPSASPVRFEIGLSAPHRHSTHTHTHIHLSLFPLTVHLLRKRRFGDPQLLPPPSAATFCPCCWPFPTILTKGQCDAQKGRNVLSGQNVLWLSSKLAASPKGSNVSRSPYRGAF